MRLLVRVEIGPVALAKHQYPRDRKDRRRGQDLRKLADSARLKFSRGDASTEHETESRRARLDDLSVIHLGKFRKFPALGNQQPEECARSLIFDDLHILARQKIAEHNLGRAGKILEKRVSL